MIGFPKGAFLKLIIAMLKAIIPIKYKIIPIINSTEPNFNGERNNKIIFIRVNDLPIVVITICVFVHPVLSINLVFTSFGQVDVIIICIET
ncbi:hypothetical protein ES703_114854 [subsurface metagenome]